MQEGARQNAQTSELRYNKLECQSVKEVSAMEPKEEAKKPEAEKKEQSGRFSSALFDWTESLVIAVLFVVVLFSFIFRIVEFFWFADFSMALVFAILFSVLLSRIYRQICARYQFE